MTSTTDRGHRGARQKPSALVQQHLRDMIFSGSFRPGEWMRLQDIAAEFEISTTPVREAVAVLIDEGLLEARTRKGITVLPLSADDLGESYYLTGVVSGRLAERAAERISLTDLKKVEELYAEMTASPDGAVFERAHSSFHRIIDTAAESRYLRTMFRVVTRNIPLSEWYRVVEDWPHVSEQAHSEILDALKLRDPAAASEAAIRHAELGREQFLSSLRAKGVFARPDPASDDRAATGS